MFYVSEGQFLTAKAEHSLVCVVHVRIEIICIFEIDTDCDKLYREVPRSKASYRETLTLTTQLM